MPWIKFKLFSIKYLKQAGIKFRERRLIYNLYQNQIATIIIGDEEREAKIKKGVRQGCVLSPMIFNLYIEEAIKEFKYKIDTGMEIQRLRKWEKEGPD